ncbi:MAG: aldo/keto reductase [Candidatus Bathyarchaeota archaeon]|nr:MAG: aldo/keto reductase [Candidatus Bathyarchaeota archaeon]
MKYRQFGKLKWKVSALGFGAMRLPLLSEERGNIDEATAIKMLRYAIDHGVNYLDTAYLYHNGNSERVVGKALKDGYREKVRLATKMPIRLLEAETDLDRVFQEQLSKLQTDHLDFYLFHGLREATWPKVRDFNVLQWAEKEKAAGRIRHLGFSFHDKYEVFKEIIDSYDGWTFCQIQYNYVDTDSSARTPGTRGLKYAASQGLAVVAMEPIQGGNLAVKPPEAIEALWNITKTKRTPAEWALQWLWHQPEVSVALSGMSTMTHVIENLNSANRSKPHILTGSELQLISRVREKYLASGFIGCTNCGYCVPCPEGVAIPEILALYNQYYTKQGDTNAQQAILNTYDDTISPETRAERCARCGVCEDKCSQQLPIRHLIARATRIFTKNE